MPTYTMFSRDSDEIQILTMTISERDKWMIDNPNWEQTLSTPLIVREAKGALAKSPDSWKDHLKKIKKEAGRDNSIHV